MESAFLSGIQQIGIGVASRSEAWAWYRRVFGMDVPIFTDAGEAPLMTRYTGSAVQSRTATLAMNLAGGGGFEIWQFESRTPTAGPEPARLGDLGILAARIKCLDVDAAHRHVASLSPPFVSDALPDPAGNRGFFVRDPWDNLFHVAEAASYFARQASPTGGVSGAVIGVSDIDRALPLYRDLFGFRDLAYDVTGRFPDWDALDGGEGAYRRVRLHRPGTGVGPFSRLLGDSNIELVAATGRPGRRLFENRYWGDLGFIHLCFDVSFMMEWEAKAASAGFPFTVNSAGPFEMDAAGGHFAYLEDPDGTLIELVETTEVPVAKNLGLKIDLTKRDRTKPLPNMLIRMLGLGRIRP